MKPMKMKQYMAALSICVMGLASCDLNISPDSYIAEDFFFEDAAQVNTAVIGCYGGLQGPMEYEWTLTELRSDNTRMRISSTTNEVNLQLSVLDMSVMNASNLNVRNYWETTYKNINNCNTVLNPRNLAVVTDDKLRNQYEGEALFIRSYHYFNLVRLFGPVFIVTESISIEESMKKERSAVGEVYKRITDDLKLAVEKLEGIKYGSQDNGRVTDLAAKSLLAKVYLTLYQYSDAKTLLEQVIAVKGETLIPYADIFDINNEMNDEIIFAIRYKAGNQGVGSPFANFFAPTNSGTLVIIGSGDGRNYPTTDIISSYEPEDKRKDVSLAENYIDESKPNPIINEAYIKKFLSAVSVRYDAENDWPVIRYADVLLMYAEVLNELESPDNALKYLNLVRTRAGISPISAADVPNRNAFRDLVEKERRLELAFENQRWFDLLRWNKAKEVVNKHIHDIEWGFYSTYNNPPGYMEDYQLILPIPQSVIDNNNGVIAQNPNY